MGRFTVPMEDLVEGMQDLTPETICEGMRIIRGRDAMVFMYADEISHKLMQARIKGLYAIDKVNAYILAGESSRTLRHGNALVFMERTAFESKLY